MFYKETLKGQYVQLRSVSDSKDDIDFTVKIRQNKEKTKYLHVVDADEEKQTEWIHKQQNAEGDYFFIVETNKGKKVGTVGIYDIDTEEKIGHLGRLLMVGNPFLTFEGVLLSMHFAYYTLNLEKLFGDVHVDNISSLNISEAVGFHFEDPCYDSQLDRWVKYGTAYKSEFPKYEQEIKNLIYRD